MEQTYISNPKLVAAVPWLTVLVWMAVIFTFSAQPAKKSNQLSKNFSRAVVTAGEQVGLAQPGTTSKQGWMNTFNNKLREYAHAFVYFVLGILVLNAFRKSRLQGVRILAVSFAFCAIYAMLDEFHQKFVPGRGVQMEDFLTDCIGALIGICLYSLIILLKKSFNSRIKI